MRRLGLIAYCAGIAAFTFIVAPSVDNIFSYLFDQPETARRGSWLVYWLTGTFGPLILSIFAWTIAYRYQVSWLPHLLFMPAAILVCIGGMTLFLRSTGVPIEDIKEADAVALATGYLLLSLTAHATAIAIVSLKSVKHWAKGS